MPRIVIEELVGQQVVNLTGATVGTFHGAFATYDCTVAMLQISGAFTAGAFTVEFSTDGAATFAAAQQIRVAGDAYLGEQMNQLTKGITFLVDVRACTHIRLKCGVTVAGGAASVTMRSARWDSDPLVYSVTQGAAPDGAAIAKGGNPVLVAGTDGTLMQTLSVDTTGAIKLGAGSNNIGNVGISPATPHNLNSAATTNATSVKNTSASLYSLVASNTGASIRYLKLYNKASAPTVGTDIPVLTLPIPAGSFINPPLGAMGARFATGLAYAITGAAADADTTAVAAGEVKVKLDYV